MEQNIIVILYDDSRQSCYATPPPIKSFNDELIQILEVFSIYLSLKSTR